MIRKLLKKYSDFIKFCIVGASGVLVNMGIYTTSIYCFKINYLMASILAFCFAAISNFTLNKIFTFKNSEGRFFQVMFQFFRFVLSSLIGLIINLCSLKVMVEYIHIHTLLAQLAAIGLATVSNFLFSKKWAFKVREVESTSI